MSKSEKNTIFITKILFALLFGGAGVAKILGIPEVHKSFLVLGLPEWFGYFIGGIEVLFALGIFIQALNKMITLSSSIVLIGAIYYHLMHTPPAEALTAAFGLILASYLFIKARKSAIHTSY